MSDHLYAMAQFRQMVKQDNTNREQEKNPQGFEPQEDHKLALEKYKLKLDFQKFILGTVVLGTFSTMITGIIQWKELELNQRDIEQKHLSQFVTVAMEKRLIERIRFAEYFTNLSTGQAHRNWTNYLKLLQQEQQEKEKRLSRVIELIGIENDRGNDKMLALLNTEKEKLEEYLGIIVKTYDANLESWYKNEKLDSLIIDEARFVWRDAIGLSGINPPRNKEVVDNIQLMARRLQEAENIIGQPVTILNWYSPLPLNRAAGTTATNISQGKAVWIKVDGLRAQDIKNKIKPMWKKENIGGIGLFSEQPDLLHLDVRGLYIEW